MTVRQYIGARYVPIFGRKDEDSIQWDNTKPYEPLTVVLYQGNSYTSRQYVPAGIDITNQEFWANTGNYNAQVEAYRAEVQTLDTDIDNIMLTLGDENNGLVKNVADNTSAITDMQETLGDEDNGLVKDVADNTSAITDMQETLGDENNGLVKNVADNTSSITTLQEGLDNSDAIQFVSGNWIESEYGTSYFGVKIKREIFDVEVNTCDGTNVYGEATKTPYDFMKANPNALIGHNCNFGSTSLTRPTRINGVNYNTAEAPHFYPLLAIDTVNQAFAFYPSYTGITTIPDTYNYAFSISHRLISNGFASTTFNNYTEQPNTDWNTSIEPRMGFGYDDDYYYAMFCEGRDKCEQGLTLAHFAALMKKEFPTIIDAYNLDGGGSVNFCVNSPKTVKINKIADFDLPFNQLRNNELIMYYVAKEA